MNEKFAAPELVGYQSYLLVAVPPVVPRNSPSSRDLRCLRFFLRLCLVASVYSGIGEVGSGGPCSAARPRVGEAVGE